MAQTKEKKVISQIENVRIKEYDKLNVVVERYEEVFNPVSKETLNKWRFKGYARSVLSALLFIQANELLIDKNNVGDLEAYLKQVEKSNAALLEVIKL
ncbi:hypothetical protein V1503_24785 [Bacillus sp. SCS-151]|uniref:hypothetical protein n=1 Tax=Nanhaiella sioensis TaxID=3115293 RepID=UPI00397CE86D